MARKNKKARQEELQAVIASNPFITDEALAQSFQVSVQTVRLDRLELSIPEHRERIKHVAKERLDEVKALPLEEVIGEVIDLHLDHEAISMLEITEDHVFSRNGIARGHYLFAQANSLAVAVINDELALTMRSSLEFNRQVLLGERIIAKAVVTKKTERKTYVTVTSRVQGEEVFQGEFVMYRSHAASVSE